MAMVLAAGFTACTSEELVESTQTNALENRKVLGDIEFVMGGVDSRFAVGEDGWTIGDNDAFGACLVDTWKGTNDENALKNYSLTNYIQTNYQYAKGEGNVFTTPARMVEGNYVFYAPFNANHLARKTMEVSSPITQTLDVVDGKVDPYSTINNAVKEGYPFFVDYKFLSAADQETSLTINFKHIYAYPEITIANEWEEDVTFEKVVIELQNANALAISNTLKVAKESAGVASSSAEGIVGSLYNIGAETTTNTYGSWVKSTVKNGLAGSTSDLLTAGSAKTNYIIVNIPEGLEVKAGKKVTFNVVMPAAAYSSMKIYAYSGDVEGYKFSTKTSLTFSPGKRYANNDYKNGTLDTSKKGKYMTFEFDDEPSEDLPASLPVTISDNDELLSAIASTEGDLTVIPGSEELEINAAVLDAMAHNEEFAKLIVNGDITVQGVVTPTTEKPALTLENVEIKETATIKGIVNAEDGLNNVVVEAGATLNLAGEVATLTNKGTVNAKEGSEITTVENKATLKIESAAASVTTLNNYSTLNIAAAGSISTLNNAFDLVEDANDALDTFGVVNVSCAYSHAGDFAGTWNIKDDGNLKVTKATAASINYSMKIENGGELSGNDVEVEGGATLTIEGILNADVKLDGVNATGTVAEKAAKIEAKNTAVVSAAITSAATAANYMTVESASALFLVNPTLTDIVSTYTYNGSVSKTDGITYPSTSVVNKLVIGGSVQGNTATLTVGAGFKEIEIQGNVYQNSQTINLGTSGTTETIKIAGNLYLNGTQGTDYNLYASKKISVGGTFTNKKAFTETTAIVELNQIAAGENITLNEAIFKSNDIAKGTKTITVSNARIASAKFDLNDVKSNAIHIEANTTIEESKKWYAAVKFTVYEGKTLTIPAGVTIETNDAAGGELITFVSHETDSAFGIASTASTKTRGQVVNKGAVKNTVVKYTNTDEDYEDWWNATLTEVAATVAGPHASVIAQ